MDSLSETYPPKLLLAIYQNGIKTDTVPPQKNKIILIILKQKI